MNKFIKPSSILFYLFMLFLFFILGASLAGISGVAKNQGLAGGAIVLGYGFLAAIGGFILAIFVVGKVNVEKIKKTNWYLLAILVIILALLKLRLDSNKDSNSSETNSIQPKKTTQPALKLIHSNIHNQLTETIGMGLFTPFFSDNKKLYFYSIQNFDKALDQNPILDSITFSYKNPSGIEITTAPPWLQPMHLKLDYGILYFKVIRIGKDYLQIEGNSSTKETYFVSKWSGEVILWPEFILNSFMLEFPEGKNQLIRVKPFDNSSQVLNWSPNLRPISVQGYWVEVEVLNENWKPIDKGWIKWRDETQLLIKYSLLS